MNMQILRNNEGALVKGPIMPAWVPAALGCFTFAVGYFRSFLLPATPLLLWGDALGYATKGARILDGELPYRDFFDFVTPGTELVYALLFRSVGVMLWGPNLLMCIMAGLATAWVTWCARRLIAGSLAYLPGLLVTGIVLAGSFDATHHWFSTMLAMGGVSVLFDRISFHRVVLAGIFSGLATSFTQSKGAAVTLVLLAYLWWRSRTEREVSAVLLRRALQFCLAAIAVFLTVNLPFLLAAGLHRWYSDVIIFPLRYFGSVSANNWHGMINELGDRRGVLKWVCLPFLYVGVPFSYGWTFFQLWRRRNCEHEKSWDQLLLLALVGTAMLAMVSPALSLRRISCASPPAMILLAVALSRRGMARAAGWCFGAISLAVAFVQISAIQLNPHQRVNLPAGHTAIPGEDDAQVYGWMMSRTHPGQWYFGMPPYTLPLLLRNPTPIEAPAPGDYSRPEQISAVINGLDRTQTKLLLLRPVMYIPHLLGYEADHLQPFQDYLFKHYRRIKVFATGDEAWERF